MQVLFLGRAPRTKETLPDFLKWCRVTRPPLVLRGLTGSQRTPVFWGVTYSHPPRFPHRVFQLRRALYDLKQAPQACFAKFSSTISQHGFLGSSFDRALFMRMI